MTAIVTALLGAGVGVGVLVVISALRPQPTPLKEVALALDRPGTAVNALTVAPSLSSIERHLGASGLAVMRTIGLGEGDKVADQLRVLGKSSERHAYEKVLASGASFATLTLLGLVLAAGGIAVPVVPGMFAAVGLGFAGFVYPDLPLTEKVDERRRAFRHAFSAYLDLVTILLAGGAGIESALEGAAESGDGWAFAEIRRALRRARLTRRTPWDAFDQLGTELGVNELNELAASISLAGDHGARVKASLTAKADALRAAQAAELEATAEARTEKMIVPVTVMILGLVLFIAFGAVEAITDGGSANFAPTPNPATGGN